MSKRIRIALALFVALAALAFVAYAAATTTVIFGTVSGSPGGNGALVHIWDRDTNSFGSTYADSSGNYSFGGIVVGAYYSLYAEKDVGACHWNSDTVSGYASGQGWYGLNLVLNHRTAC